VLGDDAYGSLFREGESMEAASMFKYILDQIERATLHTGRARSPQTSQHAGWVPRLRTHLAGSATPLPLRQRSGRENQ